jgi:anti-anti-sigma regulatory factor
MTKRKPGAAPRTRRARAATEEAPASDMPVAATEEPATEAAAPAPDADAQPNSDIGAAEPTQHKTGPFALAAECTIADASQLKSGLEKLLNDTEVVILDISAVQRIDTAGIQVITAFIRERESQGRQCQWQGQAPAVTAAIKLLGLDALLTLPEVEAAP